MLRIQSDDNMDEPINVQGTARGMLDEPMAVLFQHQWELYRKFVDNNYFYHREVYGELHRILVGADDRGI